MTAAIIEATLLTTDIIDAGEASWLTTDDGSTLLTIDAGTVTDPDEPEEGAMSDPLNADVQLWTKIEPLVGSDSNLLDRVIVAVREHVEAHYYVSDPLTDAQEQAIMLQAARLWRRRDTPEGVLAFDELGTVRISRLDPDVAWLLDRKVIFG